jgi:phage terminase large subunit GpA-like protein
MLSPESSAEPGKWRTDRAEYERGIMDAFSDPLIEQVYIMSASQLGKTDILLNVSACFMDQDPGPMLVMLPTLDLARSWSKDRFTPMVRDTQKIRGLIAGPRTKDSSNETLHKKFPGGHVTFCGANSPASLSSRPVRILLMDEVDRYPSSAGTEGDPVDLAIKRTQTFWNRKIGMTSSPTVAGVSRIELAYESSDKRRYFVPCPKCGTFQVLMWKGIKFDKHNLSRVWYECESCHAELGETDKYRMIRRGEWRAEFPERIKLAGFHLNELVSPWSTWVGVVENFLKAKKRLETLKVWVNTALGETFQEEESFTISSEKLAERLEDYDKVPADVMMLTAGVDTQDDRLEVVVKGWGFHDESWLIDKRVIYGSPGREDTWKMLSDYLGQTWETERKFSLGILSVCIDSGGHFTQNVYKYTKKNQGRRFFATKGYGGHGRPLIGKASRNNRVRAVVIPIGVDTAKELVYDRLGIDEPGPGFMHFPRLADDEYFQQLTAEKQVTQYNKGFPKKVWVLKEGRRNEMLDCEVLNLAAYTLLNPNMARIKAELDVLAKEHETPEDKVEVETPNVPTPKLRPRTGRRGPRGGFVGRW